MRKIFICLLLNIFLLSANGQEIIKVGEFTSYENSVQFLPGAVVVVQNDIRDGQTNIFKYQSGRFVRMKMWPPLAVRSWQSFNWESVDHYNQLDLSFVKNPSMAGFLPPYSKIKGYATIPGLARDKTIVVLCYAAVPDRVPVADRASEGGPRNLRLLLLSRKSGPEFTDTVYTKLTDVTVADDVSFGAMLVERETTGTFVAVYLADGGSHQTDSIAIYKLRPGRQHRASGK